MVFLVTPRGRAPSFRKDVIKLNPSGVVILIGTNDLEEGDSADSVAGNLELIISQLKKHNSKMPILLCQVMPSSATKRRPAGRIREINQKCFAVVRGDPQITVLDTWTLFADTKGDAKKMEFPDLLHPNKAGYNKWAATTAPCLRLMASWKKLCQLSKRRMVLKCFLMERPHWLGFRDRKTLKPSKTFDGMKSSHDDRYVA